MSHESPRAGSPELPEHEKQARIRTLQRAITTRLAELEVLKEELAKLNPANTDSIGEPYIEQYPAMMPGENDANNDLGIDPERENAGIHEPIQDLEELRRKEQEKRNLSSKFDDMFGGINYLHKDEQPKMYSKIMGRISIHTGISFIANEVAKKYRTEVLTDDALLRNIFFACLEKDAALATGYIEILRQELHEDLDTQLINLINDGKPDSINAIGRLCKENSVLQFEYQDAKEEFSRINPRSELTRRNTLKMLVRKVLRQKNTKLRAHLLQICNLI
jgi:hypothetical protein